MEERRKMMRNVIKVTIFFLTCTSFEENYPSGILCLIPNHGKSE